MVRTPAGASLAPRRAPGPARLGNEPMTMDCDADPILDGPQDQPIAW
jgi:hypothetical protein